MAHDYQLPDAYLERSVKREGRVHTVERLDPDSTALVVVDMQRYFMQKPYAGACPTAQEVVPNVNRLATAIRSAGGTAIWLQMEAPSVADDWGALRERYSMAAAQKRWGALHPSNPGFALWPGLQIEEDDLRVVKTRYSAFIPGSSGLNEILHSRGIGTLLIAGVATNACCESTARDAMMLDYRVAMISDCCAAATDDEHAAALNNFYLFFGDVLTTDEVLALL
ncbi:MAG: isochorismatase family cysteine hydrolase [Acidimicrobiia bacterium]